MGSIPTQGTKPLRVFWGVFCFLENNLVPGSNVQLERALIYDINGRLIQTVDLGNMDREASVNVASLSSGVYLVQLEAQGATAIKRLIKE